MADDRRRGVTGETLDGVSLHVRSISTLYTVAPTSPLTPRIMPAYVIVQVTVNDATRYEQYKELAPPSIAAHGGRYLVRGAPVETLEGSWHPTRFVVLEFPTVAAAHAWWSCEEYAAAKALRQQTAHTEMILVEGLDRQPGAPPA
jgi:uncharacterized protein (DUF1330 family)